MITATKEETGLPSVVAASHSDGSAALLKPAFRCACLEHQGTEPNSLNPFCCTHSGSAVCAEHSADPAQAWSDCGCTTRGNHGLLAKEFTTAISLSLRPPGKMIKKK